MFAAYLSSAEVEIKTSQTKRTTNGTQVSHFFIHIPKSGGTFARTALNKYAKDIGNGKWTICDRATSPLTNRYKWPKEINGAQCRMYMSEAAYGVDFANHTFTIVRSPRQHVVSQFFHCKEAPIHAKRHLMPSSLDKWLLDWHEALKNGLKQSKLERMKKKYNCYNPVNLQSHFLGFDSTQSKQDLASRFDIVGVSSQMHKSICLIMIRLSDGLVPTHCNCTTATKQDTRRLNAFDHGVKHHGNTFQLTEKQSRLVSEITKVDELLHRHAQEIFEDTVRAVEEEYSIQLCDSKEQAEMLHGEEESDEEE